jgi:site-specific DNA-methyltransferase (adenine-specific)
VRFLVSLRKIAQHNTLDRFAFVPDLPMNRVWTDKMLYTRYGLTDDEIAYIASQIKEMPEPEQAG